MITNIFICVQSKPLGNFYSKYTTVGNVLPRKRSAFHCLLDLSHRNPQRMKTTVLHFRKLKKNLIEAAVLKRVAAQKKIIFIWS